METKMKTNNNCPRLTLNDANNQKNENKKMLFIYPVKVSLAIYLKIHLIQNIFCPYVYLFI